MTIEKERHRDRWRSLVTLDLRGQTGVRRQGFTLEEGKSTVRAWLLGAYHPSEACFFVLKRDVDLPLHQILNMIHLTPFFKKFIYLKDLFLFI